MLRKLLILFGLLFFAVEGKTAYLDYHPGHTHASTPTSSDILAACLDDRKQDLACEKIIELNDFAREFIDTLVRKYGLKAYEREIGTVAGIVLYKKLTLRIFKDLDLTYNLDTEVISVNFGTSF